MSGIAGAMLNKMVGLQKSLSESEEGDEKMLHDKRKMERAGVFARWSFVVTVGLLLGLGGCSNQQVLLPKVTTNPAQQCHVGKFIWFDLFTNDLPAASRFYEALFDWSFENTASGNERVKTIRHGGILVGNAIQIPPEKEKRSSGWLSFMSVVDVDRAVGLVEENGGSVYIPPKDVPHRGRASIVHGPDGAPFALLAASGGDPSDGPLKPNYWLGSELWTNDVDGAVKFLGVLAGYEKKEMKIEDGSSYLLLYKDKQPRAGVVKIPWKDVKPNWVPYIGVKNIEAVVKKAQELGGRVLVNLDEKHEDDVAIIEDPTGAVFGVQSLQSISSGGGDRS